MKERNVVTLTLSGHSATSGEYMVLPEWLCTRQFFPEVAGSSGDFEFSEAQAAVTAVRPSVRSVRPTRQNVQLGLGVVYQQIRYATMSLFRVTWTGKSRFGGKICMAVYNRGLGEELWRQNEYLGIGH